MTGTVKWFDGPKGYGYITRTDGQGDVFVHYSDIAGKGFKQLNEGDRVEFEVAETAKGLRAEKVIVTERAPATRNSGRETRNHSQPQRRD